MIELIGKMALCLILALLLGFIIGWLFSVTLRSERKFVDLEVEDDPSELQAKLDQIKKLYESEKAISQEYQQENRELKEELIKKMAELNEKTTMIQELEKKGIVVGDRDSLRKMEKELAKKDAELKEFEEVLVKAEKTIEAKEAYIKQLLGK